MDRRTLLLAAGSAFVAGCAASAPDSVRLQTSRWSDTIALPAPRTTAGMSVEEALLRRRSRRDFSGDDLSVGVVGQLCWAAQGVTDDAGHRTAPSAGARYPIELYAVSSTTLMHYLPAGHSIERRDDETTLAQLSAAAFDQAFVSSASVTFVIAGDVARTEVEYGAAARDLMNREAGHVAQNLLLQATALDLDAVPVGGFDPARVARLMALPPGEEVLYLLPIGSPGA